MAEEINSLVVALEQLYFHWLGKLRETLAFQPHLCLERTFVVLHLL